MLKNMQVLNNYFAPIFKLKGQLAEIEAFNEIENNKIGNYKDTSVEDNKEFSPIYLDQTDKITTPQVSHSSVKPEPIITTRYQKSYQMTNLNIP